MDNVDICTFCRVLGAEDNKLIVSPRCEARICMSCATDAVVTLYREANGDVAPLLRALRGDATILFAERQLRESIAADLADRYQRELLAARDPDEIKPNEAERTDLATTVSRYTYDRVQALAAEAGLTISAWLRQAIFYAFELTSHKRA